VRACRGVRDVTRGSGLRPSLRADRIRRWKRASRPPGAAQQRLLAVQIVPHWTFRWSTRCGGGA
jgi:hypothetical protein